MLVCLPLAVAGPASAMVPDTNAQVRSAYAQTFTSGTAPASPQSDSQRTAGRKAEGATAVVAVLLLALSGASLVFTQRRRARSPQPVA